MSATPIADDPKLAPTLDRLLQSENLNATAYDKAILTLASAALAVSLTFTKDLVPFAVARYFVLLRLSWIGFVLTLLINILGFIVALMHARSQKLMAYDVWRHRTKTELDLENLARKQDGRLYWSNFAQGIIFLLSMTLLAAYVMINVDQGRKMSSEQRFQKIDTRDFTRAAPTGVYVPFTTGPVEVTVNTTTAPVVEMPPVATSAAEGVPAPAPPRDSNR